MSPPSCIFLPEPAIFNKMIETVAKTQGDFNLLLAKFSDMEQPRPQWMIDYEEEQEKRQAEDNHNLNSCDEEEE